MFVERKAEIENDFRSSTCLPFFVKINDFRVFDSAVRRCVSTDVVEIHVALRIFGFGILSRFACSELLASMQHRKESRAANVKKNILRVTNFDLK